MLDTTSLSFDPEALPLVPQHFINGAAHKATGEMELLRPSDAAPTPAIPIATADLVDEAVAGAAHAQTTSGWGSCPPRERLKVLHRLADLIEAEAVTLSQLEAATSTRPVSQMAALDVPLVAEQLRFFAEFADKEGGQLAPTGDDSLGMIASEPYGVIGAITPWNVPLSMAGWKIGPALAAGNAVVIKPSEHTPYSTLYLAELAVRAGLPKGLLNVVLGDGVTTGAALMAHPKVAKVSFTGSTRAGAAIMQNIAQTGLKPMTLELGGKSPQVVFADADLELAAASIAGSILANAGQTCVCGSRLIVEASVADDLADRIRERLAQARPGPTWEAASQYSPIISAPQIERIAAIVDAAKAAGADCVTGGARMDAPGYFYQPTLLRNVAAGSPALTQEIFGPVLTLQTFDSEDEAMALADHPTYGLCAGLYTRDLSRGLRLSRAMQAGTVWVNRYGRSRDHILPTGGYKQSGLGKDLGREAYQANRKSKSVLFGL